MSGVGSADEPGADANHRQQQKAEDDPGIAQNDRRITLKEEVGGCFSGVWHLGAN